MSKAYLGLIACKLSLGGDVTKGSWTLVMGDGCFFVAHKDCYLMLRISGVVFVTEPDVAFTRIVFAPASSPWFVPPPEHPSMHPNVIIDRTIMLSAAEIRAPPLRILCRQKSGGGSKRIPKTPGHMEAASVYFPAIVSDVLAAPPAEILACVGLKLHVSPLGSPVQLNCTDPANPDSDVT